MEHSLDIKEIRDSGNYIVDAAPRKFMTDGNPAMTNNTVYQKPIIYGKNQQTAEMLIFGGVLQQSSAQPVY